MKHPGGIHLERVDTLTHSQQKGSLRAINEKARGKLIAAGLEGASRRGQHGENRTNGKIGFYVR